MTRFLAGLTVLLIHTGAALAQQPGAKPFPSAADTGGVFEGPPAPAVPSAATPAQPAAATPAPAAVPNPPTPPPAPPAPSSPAVAQPSGGYPPGYGPPPGYVPPPGYGPPPPPRYQRYQRYGAPRPVRTSPPPYYGYPPPVPRGVTDRPFTLGASAGFGGLKLERGGATSSENGFAYSARLGVGLRPGLLVMWDMERSVVDRGLSVYSQTAHLFALQMFIGEKLFIKGGFGMALADQDNLVSTGWAPALMGGVGFELVQGWNWSFDVQSTVTGARYTIGNVDETWINWSAISFGINFF